MMIFSLSEERLDGLAFSARAKQKDVPYSGRWLSFGDETSPPCASNGVPLSSVCQGAVWKARLGVSFEMRSYFHAWLLLASSQRLQARKTTKIEVGVLGTKAGSKLEANRKRDSRNQRRLKTLGWRVLVVWECEMADTERVSAIVREFLRQEEDKK